MKLYFSLSLSLLLLLPVVAAETLTCRTVDISAGGSCDESNPDPLQKEVVLIRMTDKSNAHAASPSAPILTVPHNIKICCKGLYGISTASGPLLWLDENENAHVNSITETINPIKLTSTFYDIEADLVLAASTSDDADTTCRNNGYEACAFSASDTDDAHVGDCFQYKQSALQATGGKVYAVCLNTVCRENDCQNGFRCASGNWRMPVLDANFNGIDDDCEGTETCTNAFYDYCPTGTCRACIDGTVSSTSGVLQGATVEALPTHNKSVTNVNGKYKMALPGETYTFTASKNPYTTSSIDKVIPAAQTTTIDFSLGFGPSDCLPDCTRKSDPNGFCSKDCQGTNGCAFYDDRAADVCDGWKPTFRRPYGGGREIQCCEGNPYNMVTMKATAKTNSTVIARVTRMVWYEGKFVKMVVDVFG